jgi:D-amino-acid oxidase
MASDSKGGSETNNGPHIVVLGAGVIGLSTAAAILCSSSEITSKIRVTVVSADFSPNTTSDIAGGLWMPYKADHPDLNVWSSETLDWLIYLRKVGKLPLHPPLKTNIDSSPNPYHVKLVEGYSYESGDAVAEDRAAWEHVLKEPVKRVSASNLGYIPPGVTDLVILPQLPLVTTSLYLQRMRKELYSTGRVKFVQDKDVTSLEGAAKKYHADVLVNCTGLGARRLVMDESLHPVRGCLITVELPPDLKTRWANRIFSHDDNPTGLTYILPRDDYCYVGGTYLPHQWDSTVSEKEQEDILKRAIAVAPELARGKVIRRRAGLRPGRPSIRLERDASFDSLPAFGQYTPHPVVFHNYGHGGSGWTVHWGCAQRIASLVASSIQDTGTPAKVLRAKL